ncbi:MAG TPA: 2-hydroxycarboxylate transporter family protein, partial [Acidobacteriaceae bacterium]
MTGTPPIGREARPGPRLLWPLARYRVGLLPLPLFLLLAIPLCLLAWQRAITPESPLMIAVLATGASLCAWAGGLFPWLRRLGGPALVCAFLPSYLVARHWLPSQLVTSVSAFTRGSNFIYLFIAAVIVGSILGLERRVLLGGMLRVFVPLAAGSLAAFLVGSAVGSLTGLRLGDVLLLILVPVMAGGVGDGAIPLSVGYAELHRGEAGPLLGQILPVVLLANFVAIVAGGALNALGRRYPAWSGGGRLQVEPSAPAAAQHLPADPSATVEQIAVAFLFAIALYLVAVCLHSLLQFPVPVTMLAAATLLKLTNLLPLAVEQATVQVSRFFATAVTYPLLVAVAVALTPWASV